MCAELGTVLPVLDQDTVGAQPVDTLPWAGLMGSLPQPVPAASLRLVFSAGAAWGSAVFVQVAARAA